MKPQLQIFYPLSPMQEGILFHTLYAPGSGVYLEQTVYPLQGELNVPVFEQAWQQVIDRHEALRTFFAWEDLKKPIQVVQQKVNFPLEQHDLRAADGDQQQRLQDYLRADRQRGFALSQAPLMRLALFRMGEDAYSLVWSWHHILMDGWSSSQVVKEVIASYKAKSEGRELNLNVTRPYRDYIAWLQQQDLTEADRYWRRTLRGFSSPTPVGTQAQATNTAESGGDYEEAYVRLSIGSTAALQALARKQRLTLNTLAQGAWALLLSRYAGSDDVVFGAVVSGRPADLDGVESMVGLFINTLPVRAQVNGEAGVVEWLKQLQAAQVEARRYEYTPLVQIQGCSDLPRGARLFESLLAFENYSGGRALKDTFEEEGLRIERPRSFEQVNYPLAVVVVPGPRLLIQIMYDRQRIDSVTAKRMLDHYERLLESIASGKAEQRLRDVEMLSDSERRYILSDCNNTATVYNEKSCIHELFEKQVEERPEAIALVFGEESLNYAELNRRANRLANYLRSLGTGPESLVGICMERSPEMIIGLLGILKAGGAYLPLDPAYPAERLAYLLEETQPAVVLTQSAMAERLAGCKANIVCLDRSEDHIAAQSDERLSIDVDPANLAYVMYTSGSTGKPKGVSVAHRSVVRLVDRPNYVTIKPDDVFLQLATLSFDASTFEIWGSLLNGAQLVIFPGRTPTLVELGRVIVQHKITTLWLTSGLFHQMVDDRLEDLSGIDNLLAGGDVLSVKHVQKVLRGLPSTCVINGYGPTENTTFTCCNPMTSADEIIASVPIGRPISNTQVYLLDNRLKPVAIGAPGELYTGGDGLARGYFNSPEMTAERFIPNPFSLKPGARMYKTGDMARYLEDGKIEFIGRVDNQVKVRGFRIELAEIEAVLGEHPRVRHNAVMARTDAAGDKRLVAYIVMDAGGEGTVDDIRGYLKERLPEYMLPSAFVVMDHLPLNLNGKVDRHALPEPELSRSELKDFTAPRDVLELQVAQVWEEVFNIRPIGVTDNFFDLGGHSLLAVRLMAQIHKRFGQSIALPVLFEQGTVAALTDVLRRQTGPLPYSPLVAIQPRGTKPPFFCVHAIGGQVVGYYHLARRLGEDQPFYGLQAPFLTELGSESKSIERMASEYIKAIRSVQPEGPYLLGGYSFGGFVAFEMARQLSRINQETSLLAIMDTWSPAIYHRLPKDTDDSYMLAMLARVRAKEMGKTLSISHEELRRLPMDEQLQHVFEQLKRAKIFDEEISPEIGIPYIRSYVEGHRARQAAIHDYAPQVYAGRVTLFRCEEEDAEQEKVFNRLEVDIAEPTFGWNALSTEPVEVHQIPGYHERMCQEPHVATLAERLSACIERATTRSASGPMQTSQASISA